jgi:hypothetical protein
MKRYRVRRITVGSARINKHQSWLLYHDLEQDIGTLTSSAQLRFPNNIPDAMAGRMIYYNHIYYLYRRSDAPVRPARV